MGDVIALTMAVKVVREAMVMSHTCNKDGAKHMVQVACQLQAHEVVLPVVMKVHEITSKVVLMMVPVLAEDQTCWVGNIISSMVGNSNITISTGERIICFAMTIKQLGLPFLLMITLVTDGDEPCYLSKVGI